MYLFHIYGTLNAFLREHSKINNQNLVYHKAGLGCNDVGTNCSSNSIGLSSLPLLSKRSLDHLSVCSRVPPLNEMKRETNVSSITVSGLGKRTKYSLLSTDDRLLKSEPSE